MGYLIRDSRSKASFDFSVPKRVVYSAESEVDEPVETVIEQEEEPIPEEAQGQSTEQAPTGDSEVEELDPVQQEEEEEEDDDVWIEGGECTPDDPRHHCGPGMYCSFETSTCVSDENQEEEQAAYDERWEEENAEAKAKADQEAAAAAAAAAANATKKKTTSSKKSGGGGGGGGGRGPYMSKNDKLWKKKLSAKSKKPTTKTETKKSNVALRLVGGAVAIGSVYGIYKTMK